MSTLYLQPLDYQEDSSLYFDYFRHMPLASYLDSCAMGHQGAQGRYDIITAEPSHTVTVSAQGQVTLENRLSGKRHQPDTAPFAALAQLQATMAAVDDKQLPFTGGLLGFWAYELGELLEPEKIKHRSGSCAPLMCVGLFWWALVVDHQLKKAVLLFHPDIDPQIRSRVLTALEHGHESRHNSHHEKKQGHFCLKAPFTPAISYAQYQESFCRIQDYILAGDCYEVNLTQAFSAPYSGDSWLAYRRLRQVSPAPYSAFLAYPGLTVLSHSPERFIRVSDRLVETFPIKGTVARGKTTEEDQANARALQNSDKDKSENLMIVDLLRNDLGKVCEKGSIRVPRLFDLESYANVHHLVSAIEGTLEAKTSVFDLMASVFPGGSITGAPKIRAMEIIRELEPQARSVYCGTIGYISSNSHLDTSIAIRSLVDDGRSLCCWGGGAIVAESDCRMEYQESLTKVGNLMACLEGLNING